MGAAPVRCFRPADRAKLRQAAGLTQLQLAETVGTNRQHISGIETGRITPGPALIVKLAHALGVDPLQLTIGAGRQPRLSDLRERAGYSRIQLADVIAMPRSSYGLLERGGLAFSAGGRLEVDETVDRAQQAVYDVTERRTSEDYVILDQLMQPAMDEIESIGNRGGGMSGVPTGFVDLDALLNGLHPGQLVMVAGRPGTGKSRHWDSTSPGPARSSTEWPRASSPWR